ncbi:dienelactone hydrolase family protein [Cyanobium sp. FGCU-52]|nr:dienelactone hydrolase family protein [Cyanobium sp. FGCU52]
METSACRERELRLPLGDGELRGDLTLPAQPRGVVLFAHGSGSSRFSLRNRRVAALLVEGGLASLLFDLLTPAEAERDRNDAHLRFDLPLLTGRLVAAIDGWGQRPELTALPLGLFGASTGAATALAAAALRPAMVRAVVSRGGRPDLARPMLGRVRCPTLLIVGDRDPEVLSLNRQAARLLSCPHELRLIAGASHLFEEGDTLDQVALLARQWFLRNLPPSPG